jgi:hypothetical protein
MFEFIPESFRAEVITVISGVIVVLIGFVFTKIKNVLFNISEKAQSPMVATLIQNLNDTYLPAAAKYVYEELTKKLKVPGITQEQIDKLLCGLNKEEMAAQLGFDNLIKNLPKYLINYAKKVYPDYELTLKQKLKDYYEANKTEINKGELLVK